MIQVQKPNKFCLLGISIFIAIVVSWLLMHRSNNERSSPDPTLVEANPVQKIHRPSRLLTPPTKIVSLHSDVELSITGDADPDLIMALKEAAIKQKDHAIQMAKLKLGSEQVKLDILRAEQAQKQGEEALEQRKLEIGAKPVRDGVMTAHEMFKEEYQYFIPHILRKMVVDGETEEHMAELLKYLETVRLYESVLARRLIEAKMVPNSPK